MRARLIHAPALIAALIITLTSGATAGTAVTTWGACTDPDEIWITTEIWSGGARGEGDLICAMGYDCRHGFWSSSPATHRPNDPTGPLRDLYAALAAGLGEHLTSLTVSPGSITATSDVAVTYRVLSLVTAGEVDRGTAMLPAGAPAIISTAGCIPGPYMLIARNAAGLIVGYRPFSI